MKKSTTMTLLILFLCITYMVKGQEVTVAIAANFLIPFEDVKPALEKRCQCEVKLVAASSGALTNQIINGAPFDLFLSANVKYTSYLYEQGLIDYEPQVFVYGTLYFWSKSEAGIGNLLNENDITIGIADPELAPYGAEAKSWLEREGYWNKVKDKVIYADNIGKLNHFISLGVVDLAFTANSAVIKSELLKGRFTRLETAGIIPHSYIMVNNNPSVECLTRALQSEEIQNIFLKYHYKTYGH